MLALWPSLHVYGHMRVLLMVLLTRCARFFLCQLGSLLDLVPLLQYRLVHILDLHVHVVLDLVQLYMYCSYTVVGTSTNNRYLPVLDLRVVHWRHSLI